MATEQETDRGGFAVGVAPPALPSLEGFRRTAYSAALRLSRGCRYPRRCDGVRNRYRTIGETTLVGFRDLDWVVTTPLLVGFIGYTAGASRRAISGSWRQRPDDTCRRRGGRRRRDTEMGTVRRLGSVPHLATCLSVPQRPASVGVPQLIVFALLVPQLLLQSSYPLVSTFYSLGISGFLLVTPFIQGVSRPAGEGPDVYFFYARRQVFATKLLRDSGDTTVTPAD
ncbi:rhodopsin [Haloferax sp. wsp5]|nr:rhodopsin [Haloferax sp. wsp5]